MRSARPSGLIALALAIAIFAGAWCGLPRDAHAADTPPSITGILQSPDDRARYEQLAQELRCLVCQNQTLADSGAELAIDLRRQVETMIAEGRSNDEIKRYLVDRYGDFVLYRPPWQSTTWLLWVGPFALLGIGIVVWLRMQRARRAAAAPQPAAGDADIERAKRLLED